MKWNPFRRNPVIAFPRPATLRGYTEMTIKKNLTVGLILSALGGIAYKHFVCDRRKKAYADFYKDYNAEEDFCDMLRKGVFQCCKI